MQICRAHTATCDPYQSERELISIRYRIPSQLADSDFKINATVFISKNIETQSTGTPDSTVDLGCCSRMRFARLQSRLSVQTPEMVFKTRFTKTVVTSNEKRIVKYAIA